MAKRPFKSLNSLNVTLSVSERQKRLQPYANFYVSVNHNEIQRPIGPETRFESNRINPVQQYHSTYINRHPVPVDNQVTPFLQSNALPGSFRPMVVESQQPVYTNYVPGRQDVPNNIPRFVAIFENMNQGQRNRYPVDTSDRPIDYDYPDYGSYKTIQPTKTTIETFTATNIDISTEPQRPYHNTDYNIQRRPVLYATPVSNDLVQQYKPVLSPPEEQRPRIIIIRAKSKMPVNIYHDQNIRIVPKKPVSSTTRPYIYEGISNYVTTPQYQPELKRPSSQFYMSYQVTPGYEPEQTYEDSSSYVEPQVYQVTPKTEAYITKNYTNKYIEPSNEDSHTLDNILRHLQASNSLPQSITPNDIDNSIKTLVKILTKLKEQQRFSKPIVVEDVSSDEYSEYNDSERNNDNNSDDYLNNVNENFPADTPEGGTPGKPGIDYPALYSIPQTSFSCKTQRYKGFFGDPDTNCQVSVFLFQSRNIF